MQANYSTLLCILFFIPTLLKGNVEQLDSLRREAEIAEPKKQIDLLNEISCVQLPDTAGLVDAKTALVMARDIRYIKGMAEAHENIGYYEIDQHHIAEALQHFADAEFMYKKLQDTEGILSIYSAMISCNLIAARHDEALDFALKAKTLADQSEEDAQMGVVHFQLANVYQEAFKDNQKSMEHFHYALRFFNLVESTADIAMAHGAIGTNFLDMNALDSALFHFKAALKLAEENDLTLDQRINKSNIGDTYFRMKKFEKAMQYCKASLSMNLDADDKEGAAIDYNLLGEIHFALGEMDKSEENLEKAIALAEEIGQPYILKTVYESAAKYYQHNKKHQEAFAFYQKYNVAKDSIFNADRFNNMTKIQIRFDLADKEKKIALLEKDAELQRLYRNSLLAGGALGSLLLLLFWNRVKLKHKVREQELEVVKAKEAQQTSELETLRTRKILEAEEKKYLEAQLQLKERTLASNTAFLAQKNEMLASLQSDLNRLLKQADEKNKQQIGLMTRNIASQINIDADWKDFQLHFQHVHPDFFKKISKEYPHLNDNDQRMMAYMKMQLGTKEIARLMGISAESVRKARYRLKKKLNLEQEDLKGFVLAY